MKISRNEKGNIKNKEAVLATSLLKCLGDKNSNCNLTVYSTGSYISSSHDKNEIIVDCNVIPFCLNIFEINQ